MAAATGAAEAAVTEAGVAATTAEAVAAAAAVAAGLAAGRECVVLSSQCWERAEQSKVRGRKSKWPGRVPGGLILSLGACSSTVRASGS